MGGATEETEGGVIESENKQEGREINKKGQRRRRRESRRGERGGGCQQRER